jgi:hyperosmotically inducible periplasmic protein
MLRTAVLVLALASALTGCSAITGRPFAQWGDDSALTARVKTRLVAVDMRALTRVNVDTVDGIVYLSGIVRGPNTKLRLEDEARSVEGVKQVISHLTARGGGDERSPSALPAAVVERPVPSALDGIARLEGTRGYDEGGRHIATVHVVPMIDLAHARGERFEASQPVSHVTVHAVGADTHVPLAHYLVVLWHAPAPPAR